MKIVRQHLPETILSLLPLTLFFPVGVMNLGIVGFILSMVFAGDYRNKWQRIKSHVLTIPIVSLSFVSYFAALFLAHPAHEFWSGLWHYQTYLFLLLFISVGAGEWQQRAVKVFFAGALIAATLFYLNMLHLLPFRPPFTSYVVYSGNKSILLGILLGLAAGWMLFELTEKRDRLLLRIAVLLYVLAALIFLAKTRTGNLIFILCAVLVLWRYVRLSWQSVLAVAGICVVLLVVWESADGLRFRLLGMVHDVQAFSQGKKVSDDGIRLEMYKITAQMVAEKPLTGHGIATWMGEYQQRARGLITDTMTTPHNDYLLYATELGFLGLGALLWILGTQLFLAFSLARHKNTVYGRTREGMWIAMLTLAMMLGGMFNAILRDAVFGLAFMILLAIPLAGLQRTVK